MVALAFINVASTRGLRLENLRQRKGRLLYHFVEGVCVLRTFDGEEDPQQLPKLSTTATTTPRKRRMASVLDVVLKFMKMPTHASVEASDKKIEDARMQPLQALQALLLYMLKWGLQGLRQ
jgi:hypothetical protein